MQHIVTRTPPHVSVVVRPARFMGFIATATNEITHRTSDPVWAASELDARQRAELLVDLQEVA